MSSSDKKTDLNPSQKKQGLALEVLNVCQFMTQHHALPSILNANTNYGLDAAFVLSPRPCLVLPNIVQSPELLSLRTPNTMLNAAYVERNPIP